MSMKRRLEIAQGNYARKLREESGVMKKRGMVIVAASGCAFGGMYLTYALSDASSDIQETRMWILKKWYSPSEVFTMACRRAEAGKLPLDYDIDRPWMRSTIDEHRIINACGVAQCDLTGSCAASLLKMGCGFIEIGPMNIRPITPSEQEGTEGASRTPPVLPPVISPDATWSDLSTPMLAASIRPWDAPSREAIETSLQQMWAALKQDEMSIYGVIGVEVINNESLEETISACDEYVDYITVRVVPDEDISTLLKRCRGVTNRILFLKIYNLHENRASAQKLVDQVTKANDLKVGIITNSPEAVKLIRQRNKDLTLMCSSITSGPDAVRAIEAGACCFMLDTHALVNEGPQLPRRVKDDFTYLINARGHDSLRKAIGKVPKQMGTRL